MMTDEQDDTAQAGATNDAPDTELTPTAQAPEQVQAWSQDSDETEPLRRHGRALTAGLAVLVAGVAATGIWLGSTYFNWPVSKHVAPSSVPTTTAKPVAAPPSAPAPTTTVTAAPPPPPSQDDRFLSTLAAYNIRFTDPAVPINSAHTICNRLALGETRDQIVAAILGATPGMPANDANVITDTAVNVYCP